MSFKEVKEHIYRNPFQPFRIRLSDGRVFDVRRRSGVMLGFTEMIVGVSESDDNRDSYDRLVPVSLETVERVEPIHADTNG